MPKLQDIRYALRQLRKSPGFTITAVLTLALGIGANTAIFTLVHAVMLKSLPVANPSQLYRIGTANVCCVYGGLGQGTDGWGLFSYDLYRHIRDNTPQFEEIAAFQANEPDISVRRAESRQPAETFPGEFVSGNYFSTFGIQPFAGRVFTAQDDQPGAAPTAVMSYRAWQQHYGLDPAVIGGSFVIDGHPFTIVGITPPGFFGDRLREDPPDFYLPLAFEPIINQKSSILNGKNQYWLYLMGRMKPGIAHPAQVQAQVSTELQQWLQMNADDFNAPQRKAFGQQFVKIGPGGAGIASLKERYRAGLYMLVAASALVLLIACANLANLLLARGMARRQQTAVQLALGATRRRLIHALLTESILLACMGGAAGLALAYFGTHTILLVAFRGADFVPINTSPSLPILAFAFGLSLVTGIVFGIAPAWIASHSDPAEALRGANRSTRDRSSLPQRSLVIAQAALSLVLLAMAGLVTQSLRNLEHYNFGFQTEGRLMVQINPLIAGYSSERLPGLYRQIRERLGQIPGVRSASYSMYSPQDNDSWNDEVAIEGRPAPKEHTGAGWVRVGPDYFKTIGTPVVRGRVFGDQDTATSQRVAVVDEYFVRSFFPNQDPIGQHFGFDAPGHSGDFEIVGVVKDTRYRSPDEGEYPQYPMFFVPYFQEPQFTDSLYTRMMAQSEYVRTIEIHYAGSQAEIASEVRRTLAEIDPNLSIIEMHSFGEQVVREFNQERLIARLTELFSLLAVVLASIGLYGVTAYNIARRTGEIGIRMALGADRGDVIGMVLRGAFAQIGIGLVIGIPLVIIAGRLMANKLYGVGMFNLLALGVAVLVLTFCAFIAGFVPARRAAAIEPVKALRVE